MSDEATPPSDAPAEPASPPAPPADVPTQPTEQPSEAAETSTAQMPANEPLSEPLNAPEIAEIAPQNPAPPAPSPMPPPQPSSPPPATQTARELLAKANVKKKTSKEAKLEKIFAAIVELGRLSNDDVQALIKCSDATATRYLSTLVKQGKIRKEGKTGAHVVYVRV